MIEPLNTHKEFYVNYMNTALTIEEREFVKQAGLDRHEANKRKHDIADYDQRRFNLTNLQANRLGVFAEAATFKALGGNVLEHSLEEWAHFVPDEHPHYNWLVKQKADLFANVEIRRDNNNGSPIPIREKDRKDGRLIVMTFVPYRQALATKDDPYPLITIGLNATIKGWAYQSDWENGAVPSWSRDGKTRVVEPRSMNTFPWEEVAA